MAFGKLVNLFALSSLALLVCNYGIIPVTALSVEPQDSMKRSHGHDALAKRHRSRKLKNKKRQDGASSTCRTRSGSTGGQTTVPTSTTDDSTAASQTSLGGSQSDSSTGSPSQTATGGASSSSPITSSGQGKLGLAWPNGDTGTLSQFVNTRTKYIYTWGPDCPSEAAGLGLTCMPMLWGNDQDRINAFTSEVVAGYATIAMGFNEVNEAGQSNMDVGSAVSAWNSYLQPLASQGYSLLAPCTSSNPDGYVWMQQFLQQCSGCSIAGMPIHFYGTQSSDMITYIQTWEGLGYPVWVTEFACQNYNPQYENNGQQCSEDQVWAFYKDVISYMEGDSKVVAYFPFGVMKDMQGVNTLDQLMDPSSGGTTALMNAVMNLSF